MSRRRDDRLTQIIGLFHQQSFWTALGLSNALAVTEATIYRDIKTLQAFGIEIKGTRGKGYCALSPPDLAQLGDDIALSTSQPSRAAAYAQLNLVRRALRRQRRRALWQYMWKPRGP